MNKYVKYGKDLSTYFGASLIPMILNLVANPWIAKNMSPEDYAISGYYSSFSPLISPIIIFYMVHYYIKEYFRRNEKDREKLFAAIAKATIWFSGIIAVFCFVMLLCYLKIFNSSLEFPISPYLALMVFAIPLTGLLNLQLAQYRMEKKASAYFRLSMSNGILNISLTVLLVVWMKWGALGKLLGSLLCNALVFCSLLLMLKKYRKVSTSFTDYKKIFKFCLPLAFGAMFSYFLNGYTTTYLETVGNTIEYGYYVVGASIGGYLMVFGQAIGDTFLPDLYETTIKGQRLRYIKFCLIIIGLSSLITVSFIICAPFIVDLLTAGRYNNSTIYAQIIAFSTIASRIYYIINNYTITTNRPKLFLYTSLLSSSLIVVITPLIVKHWHFIGGAWMAVSSFVIFAVINLTLLAMSRLGIVKG